MEHVSHKQIKAAENNLFWAVRELECGEAVRDYYLLEAIDDAMKNLRLAKKFIMRKKNMLTKTKPVLN